MTGHIFVYGEIGPVVTAESIQNQISNAYDDYEIHISTVGGDVYEGYAIYGILSNLRKPKKVIIEGICASIGTLIAQSGDEVVMTDPSEFMIHNPYVNLTGDSNELVAAAGQLNQIKNTIISVYQKRTKLSKEELSQMMDIETRMTPQEALAKGFIDGVEGKLKAVAYINLNKIKMEEGNKLQSILEKGFRELKNLISPKNMATLTLEDGTQVMVMTESDQPTSDEMVGVAITAADGTPLADGEYLTAEGIKINVVGGIIEAAEAPQAPEAPDESVEALKAKIAELEAQLTAKAEVEQEVEAKDALIETQKTQISAQDKKISQFTNKVKELEVQMSALKSVTVGDQTPPLDANDKVKPTAGWDPAAEDLDRYFKSNGLKN